MNWKIAEKDGELFAVTVENKDGVTVGTQWGYTIFGPVGSSGTFKDDVVLRDPKNKRERQIIERAQRLFDSAMRKQEIMVAVERARRDLFPQKRRRHAETSQKTTTQGTPQTD